MAQRSSTLIALIGVFKLAKATLLTVLGVGGLTEPAWALSRPAEQAVTWLGMFPGRQSISASLAKLSALDRATERRLALLALAYGAVFVVEGIGLLTKKRWAEWLTIVVTTSFIPFEIYELVEKFGAGKVVTLVLNIAIVLYLLWRRIEERRGIGQRVRTAIGAA